MKILKRLKLHLINSSIPVLWSLRAVFARLTGYYLLRRKFERKLGYAPQFHAPATFNERIQHRKLFDRNPLFVLVSDKIAVRDYILRVLGDGGCKYLVPLVGVYDFPEDVPFHDLPDSFVIKANHGSGTNLVVPDKKDITQKQLIDICYSWLYRVYGFSSYQWAYTKIQKKILVEQLLLTETGEIPEDYKVHIVKGKCAFIHVDYGRAKDQSRTLYDLNWNVLPFSTCYEQIRTSPKPRLLEQVVEASIKLAEPFEYARVDWYLFGDQAYIGEITLYPGGGLSKFFPEQYDQIVGDAWGS
jgi:hypothetical protein